MKASLSIHIQNQTTNKTWLEIKREFQSSRTQILTKIFQSTYIALSIIKEQYPHLRHVYTHLLALSRNILAVTEKTDLAYLELVEKHSSWRKCSSTYLASQDWVGSSLPHSSTLFVSIQYFLPPLGYTRFLKIFFKLLNLPFPFSLEHPYTMNLPSNILCLSNVLALWILPSNILCLSNILTLWILPSNILCLSNILTLWILPSNILRFSNILTLWILSSISSKRS